MRISDWSSDVCSSDLIVVILALATALRFYFVSWLGERTVADIRQAVQRNLLRLAPGFFEENRPSAIASRMKMGRASCRERVCQYVSIPVAAVTLKKKKS